MNSSHVEKPESKICANHDNSHHSLEFIIEANKTSAWTTHCLYISITEEHKYKEKLHKKQIQIKKHNINKNKERYQRDLQEKYRVNKNLKE